MSTETEVCQLRRQDSQDSRKLNETLPIGYMWSGRRLTKIHTTSHPHHIWPDAWTRIGKAAQKKRGSNNGPSRNQNSIMPEIWGKFILLIQVTKITSVSSRMQGESWRHQRLREHHVKESHPKPAFGRPSFRKREIQGIWSRHRSQLYWWNGWIHKTKNWFLNKSASQRSQCREGTEFCGVLQFVRPTSHASRRTKRNTQKRWDHKSYNGLRLPRRPTSHASRRTKRNT